ncbi:hypothetical protein PLESTB_000480000 [Pleodorina starrii]|uniref:Uncharacterized protein n=1 Tax=Pleodorina starrii TaxID=330485 RepID=A0A9W6BFI2_9CHLO|nr:hypothetical protein PLESTB_000480000 [Pleodorina starrii]
MKVPSTFNVSEDCDPADTSECENLPSGLYSCADWITPTTNWTSSCPFIHCCEKGGILGLPTDGSCRDRGLQCVHAFPTIISSTKCQPWGDAPLTRNFTRELQLS